MDQDLKYYFSQFKYLKPADVLLMVSIAKLRRFQPGDLLIKQGAYDPSVFHIKKGLLRIGMNRADGLTSTLDFAQEGGRIGSFKCIFAEGPSEIFLEAIEEIVALQFNARAFQKLAKRNSRLLRTQVDAMTFAIQRLLENLSFQLNNSPEERYTSFCEKHPDLIQRVPQKIIASHIGVTEVSLSRIRARIAKKERA